MGCSNESKFNEPMPWIGLYIAAASFLCSAAMAADALFSLRWKKRWFPCKFFTLNATSLTLLSIASKLPVDLNSSMPRQQDQLSKLSGTILICTVMGNFFPSLGMMSDSEMMSNLIALGILVLTVIVNVGIQMGTGVIFTFWPEHAIIMFFMLVLLILLGSSALTISTTKHLLEEQYNSKHQWALDETNWNRASKFDIKKFREEVKKYWIMAHTCSPHYVIGRSAVCSASGAFCLLSAFVLVEAMLRLHFTRTVRFCSGESDYKWSSMTVFVVQVIAIGIGTIAPACRWFNSINFSQTKRGKWFCKKEFLVERYWVHRLMEWKERPLPFGISSRRCRKIASGMKNQILDICIAAQCTVVIMSKLVRCTSKLPMCFFNIFISSTCKIILQLMRSGSASDSGSNSYLGEFVLHLQGEEELVHLITTNGCEATEQWTRRGKKNQPTHLLELLQKSTTSQGFKGVGEFDSDRVLPIGTREPPNCWGLTVVTLMSIAMALPDTDRDMIKRLLRGVNEGLRYVGLVEENLDAKGLINMRDAVDIVWQGIDLYDRWLDEDLHKWCLGEGNAKEVVQELAYIGKKRVLEFITKSGGEKDPLEWPAKILAANSMHRVSQTILMEHRDNLVTVKNLLEWINITIADILGACLTNLPRVISKVCFCSTIEVREVNVREAAYLLGETEKILDITGREEIWGLGTTDSMADIDEWRLSKSITLKV